MERFVSALGVEPLLQRLYRGAILRFADETITLSAVGISAIFRVTTYIELKRFRSFSGERDTISDLLQKLEPSDVFYDIGANTGLYTCFVAQKLAKQGTTVAFEPHPENVSRLESNLELNDAQAQVIPKALSDSTGQMELAIDPIDGHQPGAGTHALTESEDGESITIDTVTVDELVTSGELPEPDIIKIDVEGAETAVLRGMDSTLTNSDCRAIFCEIHPGRIAEFGDGTDTVQSTLEQHGFEISRREERGDEVLLYATRALES